MNPELLRAMADALENPEEIKRQIKQAKAQLFELAAKFDQEKPQANKEDLSALAYGLSVVMTSQYDTLKQMEGLTLLLRMAHWLGEKEGRRLGHKQAQTEQLFQNIKDPHTEEK